MAAVLVTAASVAMHEIALIDYRAGNLTSVKKAFAAVGADLFVPAEPGELARRPRSSCRASAISAPPAALHDGVGRGHSRRHRRRGVPLLGICLGMQWLFEGSDEAPERPGLGLLAGHCYRLPARIERHLGQDPARRMERARSAPRAIRSSTACRAGLAGVLHPQLRRADHAPTPSPSPSTGSRSRRSSSAATSPACSSIRRNRGRSGLTILQKLPAARLSQQG